MFPLKVGTNYQSMNVGDGAKESLLLQGTQQRAAISEVKGDDNVPIGM